MDGLYTIDNERVDKKPSADPSKKWWVCKFHLYKLLISNSLQNRRQQTSAPPPVPKTRLPSSSKAKPRQSSKTVGVCVMLKTSLINRWKQHFFYEIDPV